MAESLADEQSCLPLTALTNFNKLRQVYHCCRRCFNEKPVSSVWVLAYVKASFCVIVKAVFGKYLGYISFNIRCSCIFHTVSHSYSSNRDNETDSEI